VKLTSRQKSVLEATASLQAAFTDYEGNLIGALTPCIGNKAKPLLYPNSCGKAFVTLKQLEKKGLVLSKSRPYKATFRWIMTEAGHASLKGGPP